MAILVTGGAGYIGSHMVWALIDAGDEVVVLDRLSSGFRWAIAPEAKFYEGDVADRGLLSRIFSENSIEAIIHFAGSIVVPDSMSDPLAYYENNTVKSRALMSAAVEAGIRYFIFSSTAAVYGTPETTAPVTETMSLHPESPYGSSKLMTEIMLRDTAKAHDFHYTTLRYFNVAGADPKGRTGQSSKGATQLIKVACEAASGNRTSIDVFGTDYPTPDGSCIRDFIHVADLVDVHLKALNRLRAGGTSLVANCGYGHGYSVLEVLDSVRRVYGRDFAVNIAGRREGDIVSILADSTVARQTLGWVPQYDDLDGIVRSVMNWEEYLKRKNSC